MKEFLMRSYGLNCLWLLGAAAVCTQALADDSTKKSDVSVPLVTVDQTATPAAQAVPVAAVVSIDKIVRQQLCKKFVDDVADTARTANRYTDTLKRFCECARGQQVSIGMKELYEGMAEFASIIAQQKQVDAQAFQRLFIDEMTAQVRDAQSRATDKQAVLSHTIILDAIDAVCMKLQIVRDITADDITRACCGKTIFGGVVGASCRLCAGPTVNDTKFRVEATTGNTTIDGSLTVEGPVIVDGGHIDISGSATVCGSVYMNAECSSPSTTTIGTSRTQSITTNIGSENKTSGTTTVNIATGDVAATGSKVVNIGTGTNSGTGTVTIGIGTGTGWTTNIGAATISSLYVTGTTRLDNLNGALSAAGGVVSASDRRIKTNINALNQQECLSAVNKLKPVSYYFTPEFISSAQVSADKAVGFIAQDVEQVIPEVVSQVRRDGYSDLRALAYDRLVPYLVASIQAQTKTIDALNKRIEVLEKR